MTQESEIIEFQEEDSGLTSALAMEFRSAPWYISSVAIHTLLFLFLLLIPISHPNKKKKNIIITTEIIDQPNPIEEPDIDVEEKDPEIPTEAENNIESPIVITTTDIEIDDHIETEDDVEDNTARGDPDSVSTIDSDVTGTPALMGVGNSGGNSGGKGFGFRTGGGKKRTLVLNGGSRKTESSVNSALKWLAEHQEPDGHWDCEKYGGAKHNVAVTSMATLAFLGAGNSAKFGKYKHVVLKATYWLLKKQKETGQIGPHRYEAGISLMTIAECLGMGDKSVKEQAQKATDWAVKSQCPTGGWDYSPSSVRVDTSVTGWWIMGLKSAKSAGLHVPYEVIEKATKYIQQATTDPKNNKGYGGTCTISYSSKTKELKQVNRGGGSSRLTAVSLTCLQFLGKPKTDPQVIGTANQVMEDGFCNTNKFNFYRWYYAALGCFQMGVKSDYWRKWNEPMKDTLVRSQVKVGTYKENRGSWNYDSDQYGNRWGRVGQTALGALMLEVYYRYENIH